MKSFVLNHIDLGPDNLIIGFVGKIIIIQERDCDIHTGMIPDCISATGYYVEMFEPSR